MVIKTLRHEMEMYSIRLPEMTIDFNVISLRWTNQKCILNS